MLRYVCLCMCICLKVYVRRYSEYCALCTVHCACINCIFMYVYVCVHCMYTVHKHDVCSNVCASCVCAYLYVCITISLSTSDELWR